MHDRFFSFAFFFSIRSKHQCPDCPKSYTCKSHLTRHRKAHHDYEGWQHKCKVCAKSFPNKQKLSKHLTKIHGIEEIVKFRFIIGRSFKNRQTAPINDKQNTKQSVNTRQAEDTDSNRLNVESDLLNLRADEAMLVSGSESETNANQLKISGRTGSIVETDINLAGNDSDGISKRRDSSDDNVIRRPKDSNEAKSEESTIDENRAKRKFFVRFE